MEYKIIGEKEYILANGDIIDFVKKQFVHCGWICYVDGLNLSIKITLFNDDTKYIYLYSAGRLIGSISNVNKVIRRNHKTKEEEEM